MPSLNKLISSRDFGITNFSVARRLGSLNGKTGLNASTLLSSLIRKDEYHSKRNELVSDPKYGSGWFYWTREKVSEDICLSRRNQDNAIKILVEAGLIEKVTSGYPSYRYFRLRKKEIESFLKNSGEISEKKKCARYLSEEKAEDLSGKSDENKIIHTVGTFCAKTPDTSGCTDELKLSEGSFCTTPLVQNVPRLPPVPYIPNKNTDKNNMKEKSEKKRSDQVQPSEIPCAPSSRTQNSNTFSPVCKKERAPEVFLSDAEHKALLERHGNEAFVSRCYEKLSIWKSTKSEKDKAKYRSDYGIILRWVIKQVEKDDVDQALLDRRKEWLKNSFVRTGHQDRRFRNNDGSVADPTYDNLF